MILLDTNVISELMRTEPAQIVLDWFGDHDSGDLFISAVTEAELRTGVAILPDGQRRDWLQLVERIAHHGIRCGMQTGARALTRKRLEAQRHE